MVGCSDEPRTPLHASDIRSFVGSQQCASCHVTQFEMWQGSHHQRAMQTARSDSVLGDFSDVLVKYFDSQTRFFQRDGQPFIETQDASGSAQEFAITHTFGIAPLQQYLVDGPRGTKQALPFLWDTREKSVGGQRWYHLYPDQFVASTDPLHWTGRYFNWNVMCAECHSTNVQVNYDLNTDTFNTTYDEISVGCEACHGPGSRHVEQATQDRFDPTSGLAIHFDDRVGATWVMHAKTGIASRTKVNLNKKEPEACGQCHARRTRVAKNYEYGTPLANTHMPALLDENLYHADGRIQDEVYVYGSFLQSKMYAAGVTCSDCHEPHSGQLRAGSDPNNTCSSCHLPARFATLEHSAVQVGDCVSCHMPATTYMGVDDRRDHSFRLPNTATDPDHYGAIIAAGRRGNANTRLLEGIANEVYPAIARATMLSLLTPTENVDEQTALLQYVDSPDPLIRMATMRALRKQPDVTRLRNGSQLLRDPVRSVRIEAALTYAEYRNLLSTADNQAFERAADDYRASIIAAPLMPDAALNLAAFEARLGNAEASATLFQRALEVGANSAPVQHAYGLHLVRLGHAQNALEHLHKASILAPDVARYAYVYGVALNSLGQSDESIRVLRQAFATFPQHFDIGWALATVSRDAGERSAAREVAADLIVRFPDNEQVRALIMSLDN